MTVKELKNALKGISEPIDRIAGFCDNYEQMFERCQINVLEHAVQIDTIEDLFEPDSTPTIPEAIAEILALPEDLDNYIVAYEGEDNNAEHRLINRVIRKIAVIRGATGIGISLQGPHPSGVLNQHGYLTKLFVNDERAKSLNEMFYDFLDELDFTCDFMDSRETDEGIFIDFVSDGVSSASLIALMAGTFKEVVFCRTPFTSDKREICRLTNDHEGRYWSKRAAVFSPADDRRSVVENRDYQYCIQDMVYDKRECDTEQEVEQFIAQHNPDEELGDIVVRIVSRYIDDPLDLILKPWPEDEYE